jgi:hypothetical protein
MVRDVRSNFVVHNELSPRIFPGAIGFVFYPFQVIKNLLTQRNENNNNTNYNKQQQSLTRVAYSSMSSSALRGSASKKDRIFSRKHSPLISSIILTRLIKARKRQ